jgi:arginase
MTTKESNLFGLLGTAIGHGQPKRGVERSYEYLEMVGFFKELKDKHSFQNFGALPQLPVQESYNALFHKTLEILNSGYRPLLLGGDHSQAFASISALCNKYPDLHILWFDAHADINTPETSPSGNSHGMPLSGLLGLVDKNIWGMPWMNQLLRPDQVIHLGVRDIDQGERQLMAQHQVEYYSPTQIKEIGLSHLMQDIGERWKNFPVHLSFDIDGLDQSLVPATGTPVPGGLTMEDAKTVIDHLKNNTQLVSAEVVEFNPDIANNPEELFITETNVKEILELILAPTPR